MNALAHAAESLVTYGANPVASMAALRGAELLAQGLDGERPDGRLALGSLLSSFALDSAGIALHHVLCQTIVRTAGSGHAATNACMLPHTLEALAERAPEPMEELAAALRVDRPGLAGRVRGLSGGGSRLSELGVGRDLLPRIAEAAGRRDELSNMPNPATAADLLSVLEAAW
jgi:hypothetical protein